MSIGGSITLVSCLAGIVLALPALLALLSMIFWRTTERAALRLTRGGIVPFFIGAVPLTIMGVVGSILLSLGSVFQFFGSVIWLFLLLWGFLGLAAVARLIGVRIAEMTTQSHSPFMEMIMGAFVLTFAIAFPLIGWFLILPFGIAIGTGAFNMALFGNLLDWFRPAPARKVAPTYEYVEGA